MPPKELSCAITLRGYVIRYDGEQTVAEITKDGDTHKITSGPGMSLSDAIAWTKAPKAPKAPKHRPPSTQTTTKKSKKKE